MKIKFGAFCAAVAFTLCAGGAPAQSLPSPSSGSGDPTLSIALTWVFGKGPAVGVKAFSTDREGDGAFTLGVDYLLNSGAWRPNVGAAYIDDNAFLDFSLGFGSQGYNFGVGVGPIDSKSDSSSSYPVVIELD